MPTLTSKLQLSIVITLLCCCYAHAKQQRQTITGKVVAIADGDTLTVLDGSNKQYKIRLQGIDTPERRQAFGTRARQALSDFVFDKEVRVLLDKQDRYGRFVGKVLVGDRDINLEMIRVGLAWHYKAYQNEQSAEDRSAYDAAEAEARASRRGLWADAQPMPPWEYRRGGNARGSSRRRAGAATGTVISDPAMFPPRVLPIIGNRRSKIYHRPECPNYLDVSPANRVEFKNGEEAEGAGYRIARNCSP